jgi:uncharacterized membrane protein YheB (UPF0754 family)
MAALSYALHRYFLSFFNLTFFIRENFTRSLASILQVLVNKRGEKKQELTEQLHEQCQIHLNTHLFQSNPTISSELEKFPIHIISTIKDTINLSTKEENTIIIKIDLPR